MYLRHVRNIFLAQLKKKKYYILLFAKILCMDVYNLDNNFLNFDIDYQKWLNNSLLIVTYMLFWYPFFCLPWTMLLVFVTMITFIYVIVFLLLTAFLLDIRPFVWLSLMTQGHGILLRMYCLLGFPINKEELCCIISFSSRRHEYKSKVLS